MKSSFFLTLQFWMTIGLLLGARPPMLAAICWPVFMQLKLCDRQQNQT
ncbi:hypothetical protein QUB25_28475 [Microcoleus sp. B3-D7]